MGEKTKYDVLQFAIVDCIDDVHERENVTQELDEYFMGARSRQEMTEQAMNVLSRYEFMLEGEDNG